MLVDKTNGTLDEVRAFAERTGQTESLEKNLAYLAGYACHETPQDTRCLLFPDFAPMSFEFVIERRQADGGYARWFNGGMIYFEKHESGVGGPQCSVRLDTSESGWSIHT